ncbi:ATP-grasp domain-containing protein [Candidatus Riflebacteria bacterium]
MMKDKTLRVAVTGLNSNDNTGPGLGVLRCLLANPDQSRLNIVGLVYDALEPAIFNEEFCQYIFLLPYPSVGERAYLERLKSIHKRFPIDVFLPTLDLEIPIAISAKEILKDLGIATYLPPMETFSKRSKSTLCALGDKFNFKVPRTKSIFEPGQIPDFNSDFVYPYFIKGSYYDAYFVKNPAEALYYFQKIQAKWGLPVLIQEMVRGIEYDAVTVGDGEGGHFGILPMRKTYITEKGKAWAGISIKDPALFKFGEQVISALKWKGPMELEIMKSNEGELFLLEVNPRFPAWIYLCAECDINMPWQVIKLALGEKVEKVLEYKSGMQFARCALDYVLPLKPFEELTTHGEIIREIADDS